MADGMTNMFTEGEHSEEQEWTTYKSKKTKKKEKRVSFLCPVERLIEQVDKKTEDIKMSLCFQVADVKKPFISVKRIVEKGNKVCFFVLEKRKILS